MIKYDQLIEEKEALEDKCRSLENLCSASQIDMGKMLGNMMVKEIDGSATKKKGFLKIKHLLGV